MIDKGMLLRHYKREDIQREMVLHANGKEVSVKYWNFQKNEEAGFGKRPDVIRYSQDILELAKEGVSSFHCSVEIWSNPLNLSTEMDKRNLDALRIGWDLILDIDFPDVEYSKKIADLLIKAIKEHGVRSVGCKFSGNKGFHIVIPFEAFPEKLGDVETRLRFPEDVALIGRYLVKYINQNDERFGVSSYFVPKVEEIVKLTKRPKNDIMKTVCESCSLEQKKFVLNTNYSCPNCAAAVDFDESLGYTTCKKCKTLIKKTQLGINKKTIKCSCGGSKFKTIFNFSAIIDFGLISSRHMYRMPYSLHEKSGLASIPIDPDKVMEFKKDFAKPENVKVTIRFLDREKTIPGEANQLFDKATIAKVEAMQKDSAKQRLKGNDKSNIYFDDDLKMIAEENFPPCIKKILSGLEDGKKRALFVLVNFLTSVGWTQDMIEKRLIDWNKANKEPLREVFIKGHLRYHKDKKILPPNCRKYYEELGICNPDNLCNKIKNPVSYAKRKK